MPDLNDATRGRILYGGDYNPEQWPEETWQEDVRLMRQAGVTSVTVGVFSWARLEPAPGAYDFGWLDRLLDLLHAHGIGVVLATPTASPPPWLGHRHPETLPQAENGTTVWYGSRNQFCASSPTYRRHAAAITEQLAARYGAHPALTMWHVNNEYGTHCWCDETAAHFRRWLQGRHGTLEELNSAWGTAFWSQHYAEWDEILPPRQAQYIRNPAQLLDFARFTSDALLECYTAEHAIVARHSPAVPVTTNHMPFWRGQDGWAWAKEQDVVALDIYPDPDAALGAQHGALVQDLARSLAGGPWMLMEQAAGAVNWRPVNRPKPAGLNRLWSLQAVARGADAICFFQWRQSRQGAEKFHSAMLPHSGTGNRVYREAAALGADLDRLGPAVAGTPVAAEVALLHDWDAWWASEQPGRPSELLDYQENVTAWHRALWEANHTTDLAHPAADLTRYRLVVIPSLYLLTDAALDNLAAHVRTGGTLVTGYFTGVADHQDRIRPGGVDARLREVLGLAAVHQWWPLNEGETLRCTGAEDFRGPLWAEDFQGSLWAEELETAGAEVVARYADGELAGHPAVTRHAYGEGTAWYLSTRPEPDALRALLTRAARESGLRPAAEHLPAGVEAVRRGELLFLLNHGPQQASCELPGHWEDLLTGKPGTGTLTLERHGAAVLRPAAP
ncbi:beta-galactosidase [Kitasatospora cineracea]|uniref:beta-galactosidase n=1 Tax=Kitasatospora cineracea TaxID=88074 RepID=UPI0036DD8D62